MATRVRSYSKINLGLAIGPLRPDGFHSLTTLYQTLALHDVVTVDLKSSSRTKSETEIRCTSNSKKVPLYGSNTAVKMLQAALKTLQIQGDIDLHIQKNLPVQGGLGAGSANAVAALIALEIELKKSLPDAQLTAPDRLRLAAEIGSDVPLFLLGGTVLGLNHGEEVYPFPDLPQTPAVVVIPPVGVSTPQAFSDWDKLPQNKLTPSDNSDRLNMLSRVLSSAFAPTGASGVLPLSFANDTEQDLAGNPLLALVRTGIENDFEQVVFPLHTSLRALKRLLAGPESADGQAVYAALSGSGSALFGLYKSEADAQAAQQRVMEFAAKELPGTEALLTRTIQRDAYWRQMILQD
jgi:4-diphosphocytidyl-2-C-methyl-D-erythritol kinase